VSINTAASRRPTTGVAIRYRGVLVTVGERD
jgi:hypothetical protein